MIVSLYVQLLRKSPYSLLWYVAEYRCHICIVCTYNFLTKHFKKTQGVSVILSDSESHKTMRLNFQEADKQGNIVCITLFVA